MKGFGATSYKKLTFFTCPKTFSLWDGFVFPFHDEDNNEDVGRRKRRRMRKIRRTREKSS